MQFEIVPYRRAGLIFLGMEKLTIRTILGSNFSPFMRGPNATNETDAFDEQGIYIEYDLNDKCESITLCLSAGAIYQNRQLIGRRIEEVRHEWEGVDSELEYDGSSLISRAIGLAVYEEDGEIRAVTLFARGYYEQTT